MANLKSNIFSPIIGKGDMALFHASGSNFLVDSSTITEVSGKLDDVYTSLVEAMYTFDVNESGIKAYYDLRNNKFVSYADENSITNSANLFNLTEMKQFLTEKKKQLKLDGQVGGVIDAIDKELVSVDQYLTEANNLPMVASISFDAIEDKTYMNSTEIIDEHVAEHIFATGQIVYEHKDMLRLFEIASKNFNIYQTLEFVSEISEGDVTYSVMRKNLDSYVYRYNSVTKMSSLNTMSITETIDYILENTGEDVSNMFEDILEAAKESSRIKSESISNLYEMISFLKDKRGHLADYNKNIAEIKEADNMINQEIKKLEKEIKIIETEELSRNDGYVPGTLETDIDGITSGSDVMVDALAYATAGSNDSITFFSEEKPYKVEKRFIELAVGETV